MATITDLFNLAADLKSKGINLNEAGESAKESIKSYIKETFPFAFMLNMEEHFQKVLNHVHNSLKEKYKVNKK